MKKGILTIIPLMAIYNKLVGIYGHQKDIFMVALMFYLLGMTTIMATVISIISDMIEFGETPYAGFVMPLLFTIICIACVIIMHFEKKKYGKIEDPYERELNKKDVL